MPETDVWDVELCPKCARVYFLDEGHDDCPGEPQETQEELQFDLVDLIQETEEEKKCECDPVKQDRLSLPLQPDGSCSICGGK
jgi:hypothetical protein